MKTNLRFDHHLLAVEGEHDVHCMLELEAPTASDADRAPLHIALVIDRSGSMNGPKLAVAKDCARFLASRLLPTDQLAVVAFDNEVDLLAPLVAADSPGLSAAISSLHPRGSTNLSGGWLKGLEELNRAEKGGVRRVLLLTDGQANQGITDRTQLEKMADGSKSRASTTTIGFGDGFDEDLLTAIADRSSGNAYFAASPEDVPGIFAEEFKGLVTLVAQNVSIEIRPTDSVQFTGVLNDYRLVDVPGGVQAQIGDAYGSERRRLVFAFHVPTLASLGPAKIADVIVRYAAVGDDVVVHEVTVPVIVNLVSSDEAAAAEVDSEVTDEIWLLRAATARRDAITDFDARDYDASREKMQFSRAALLKAAKTSPRAAEMLEEAELLSDLSAPAAIREDPMWRKRASSDAYSRTRGRPSRKRG